MTTFPHFLESRDKQTWKEAFKDVKLYEFNVDLIKLKEKPNLIKQDFAVAKQQPLALTSVGNRCTNELFEIITKDKGWYFSMEHLHIFLTRTSELQKDSSFVGGRVQNYIWS